MPTGPTDSQLEALVQSIRQWSLELGFQQLGITDADPGDNEAHLQRWLDAGNHGGMAYMERHGSKRTRPSELIPGTARVISVRMDYLAQGTHAQRILEQPEKAYISRYALGRDYHKLVRKRLAMLAQRIEDAAQAGHYRAFVDSAPVLERAFAEKAGLGWIAKNTMLINSDAGSWFFLGEIFTDLPLPIDPPHSGKHCGTCTACLDICPTDAFKGPFELDARRCISYLTIEHAGSIDEELRPMMGNRVFGCDDCQLCCPWNKFAQFSDEADFTPRHGLQDVELAQLMRWDEATYLEKTQGSAMRRIGHERWLRNIAVALGNAPTDSTVVAALQAHANHPSSLVREHVHWALARHGVTPTAESDRGSSAFHQ